MKINYLIIILLCLNETHNLYCNAFATREMLSIILDVLKHYNLRCVYLLPEGKHYSGCVKTLQCKMFVFAA